MPDASGSARREVLMYAAAFVIPLAAMAVPIVLILLAVLIEV